MDQENANDTEDLKSIEAKGWNYYNQKKYAESIAIWDEVFQIDQNNIAAYQGKIACFRKMHNFVDASELLRKALEFHPSHIGILSERAWLYLEQKKDDAAINAFDEVLKQNNKSEDIWLWKIFLLRNNRHFEHVRNLIEEASLLFPTSLRIRSEFGWLNFYERRYSEAKEIFNEILVIDKLNESALQGKIAILRTLGEYDEAIKTANWALDRIEKSSGILSERGWINFQQEHYDEAAQDFKKVEEINPDDPYSHINLAWSLVRKETKGDFIEAESLCRKALRISPYLAEAFGCLGNIAFKQGHIREAESFFIESIKVDSQKGHFADLGALYSQMGQYEEAKLKFDQALKNNPDDSYAREELGNLYLQTDNINEAIREFRLATVIDPQNPSSFNGLAIALIENLKLLEAEKVLRNAIRKLDNAKRWPLHLTLCRLLTILGDQTSDLQFYEDALKEVNTAIRLRPDHPSPYFYSGIVRFKLEDYRNSLNSFKNCLKEDEFHYEAQLNERRVRALIRKDRVRSRGSRLASLFLVVVFLLQLIVLWFIRYYHPEKISDLIFTVLAPILLGLIVVSVLLPWLSRLKMTGLEATLSEQSPKETLNNGPRGEIGFNKVTTISI
jgi:tetratricopeptide (TPR) repeat protein